ncbi:DUF2934 domain-containing protein [Falsirhodobacter xinxiangensis]|uniref:DUF2934 domain-containing protein n=1 Tax=Falsirhodobacter xinxiangensis TaxID=2530049 RepID=UPI0010AA795D|nr:DUF2934 domain-containing protein [Rhodobacter xinxiangensis]
MSRIDEVEKRAYEIWEREGRPDGAHEDHWRRAKEELGTDEPQEKEVGGMLGGQSPEPGSREQNLSRSVSPPLSR